MDRVIITIAILSILLCAAIGLCFAYKAKLDEANRYIQFIQGGFPK